MTRPKKLRIFVSFAVLNCDSLMAGTIPESVTFVPRLMTSTMLHRIVEP